MMLKPPIRESMPAPAGPHTPRWQLWARDLDLQNLDLQNLDLRDLDLRVPAAEPVSTLVCSAGLFPCRIVISTTGAL